MADISDTRGTLIVKIDKPIEEVKKIIEDMSDISTGWGDYITELLYEDIKEVNPNMYSVPFWGSGRYSFFSNVNWFVNDKKIVKVYNKYDVDKLQLIFIYDDLLECMGGATINTVNVIEIYRIYSPTGKVLYLSKLPEEPRRDLNVYEHKNKEMYKYYYPYLEEDRDDEEIEVVKDEGGSES